MRIKINGEQVELDRAASIADIVEKRALLPERIVVEHNFRIVPRQDWAFAYLKDEDSLEIVSFMGGGQR